MPAVNAKIGIQSEYSCVSVLFRESNQAGICQRHGPVPIPAHQRPYVRLLLPQRERDANCASLQQSKQSIRFAMLPFEEEGCLSKDRLACQQRRVHALPLLDNPCMVSESAGEERDQGTGIQQEGAFIHRPKPSMYLGFTARSSGSPLTVPARSRAKS